MTVEQVKWCYEHNTHGVLSLLYPYVKDRIAKQNFAIEEIAFAEEFLCFESDYFCYFNHMVENGLIPKRIIDIGCQLGFQCEVFADYMDYIGIDPAIRQFFDPDRNNVSFISEMFPAISINLRGETVVSNMSLGYFNKKKVTDEIIVSKLREAKTLYIGSTWEIINALRPSFKHYELFDKGALEDFPRCAMWN